MEHERETYFERCLRESLDWANTIAVGMNLPVIEPPSLSPTLLEQGRRIELALLRAGVPAYLHRVTGDLLSAHIMAHHPAMDEALQADSPMDFGTVLISTVLQVLYRHLGLEETPEGMRDLSAKMLGETIDSLTDDDEGEEWKHGS